MKREFVFFIVGVLFFGAFSVQNANAQNVNNAQRIIGTWVDESGYTWVFNANGTLTRGSSIGTYEYKFGVTDTHLATCSSRFYGTADAWDFFNVYEISISSDGRTIILVGINVLPNHSSSRHWLTKR
jgi:hypothetical protein